MPFNTVAVDHDEGPENELKWFWLRRSKMLENIEEAFDTAQSHRYSLQLSELIQALKTMQRHMSEQ